MAGIDGEVMRCWGPGVARRILALQKGANGVRDRPYGWRFVPAAWVTGERPPPPLLGMPWKETCALQERNRLVDLVVREGIRAVEGLIQDGLARSDALPNRVLR